MADYTLANLGTAGSTINALAAGMVRVTNPDGTVVLDNPDPNSAAIKTTVPTNAAFNAAATDDITAIWTGSLDTFPAITTDIFTTRTTGQGVTLEASSAATQILSRAIGWWDAEYSLPGETVAVNKGTGGTALNAQYGSVSGADTNDPLFLPWTGENYVHIPTVPNSGLSVTDSPEFDVVGDLELEVILSDPIDVSVVFPGNASLLAKETAGQRSYYLRLASGTKSFAYGSYADGTTSAPYVVSSNIPANVTGARVLTACGPRRVLCRCLRSPHSPIRSDPVATLAAQMKPLWRVGTDLRAGTLQRQALAATSQALKLEALEQMRKVIGADLTMSNYPRGGKAKPRKAGFGYELHSNNTATLNFRPGGMWRIVEDGTSQHTIGGQGRVTNRGNRIGRRNESQVYKIGGQYRSGIRHVKGAPSQGSPGKTTIRQLPKEWETAFAKQYGSYF